MNRFTIFILALSLISAISCSNTNEGDTRKNAARIDFEKTNHDFGQLDFGSDGVCEFVFSNSGSSPLVIANVKSSCGCTIPEWTKEPIKAGEKGSIRVSYDTYRIGSFTKSITVYSNAQNSPIRIFIKGRVKSKEDSST